MNETAILDALKSLIDDNKSTLVTGMTHQGQARAIEHITTSVLTPPVAYYYIALEINEVAESSKFGVFATAERPPRSAVYNCEVNVADYLVGVAGEAELYETMHNSFRLLVDRIAKLIEEQKWIPSISDSPKVRLVRSGTAGNDRAIQKVNTNQGWFDQAESYHALAFCQLRFLVADETIDNTLLYP